MRTDILAIEAKWMCPVCGNWNKIRAPDPLGDTVICENCKEEFIVEEIDAKVGTLKEKSELEKKIEKSL